ncbi:MAG: putative membrane protein [Flavobacteriaceae bacterium]|jgi:putative membrane protein|tara:strand:+ start:5379 stop:5897 length:519 start_codon:yes stop_codon:yes gene_type:complete
MVQKNKFNLYIWIVSILIPVVVAILFTVRIPNVASLSFLPPIYATINGITAFILLIALNAIKKQKIKLHKNLMKTAIALSLVFLVMYVAYHMTSDSTPYGGEGSIRYVYFFILISHIILSIGIIPMVLITYVRAFTKQFEDHKKIARYTFPIWLYIALTGVVVYLMISPYYI